LGRQVNIALVKKKRKKIFQGKPKNKWGEGDTIENSGHQNDNESKGLGRWGRGDKRVTTVLKVALSEKKKKKRRSAIESRMSRATVAKKKKASRRRKVKRTGVRERFLLFQEKGDLMLEKHHFILERNSAGRVRTKSLWAVAPENSAEAEEKNNPREGKEKRGVQGQRKLNFEGRRLPKGKEVSGGYLAMFSSEQRSP